LIFELIMCKDAQSKIEQDSCMISQAHV